MPAPAPQSRRVARIARQLCAADQEHLRTDPSTDDTPAARATPPAANLQQAPRSSPSAAAAATPEKVFSDDEMEAWREHGWIVLREAVAPELCEALIAQIWAQLQQDPHDSSTWYTPPGLNGRADHHEGFVTLEALAAKALQWEMCQSERVYAAHAQLLGSGRLRLALGGAYMKPPYIGGDTLGIEISGPTDPTPENIFHRRGGQQMVPGGEMALHFDTSVEAIHGGEMDPASVLQSQISLNDTPGDGGGTALLPGFHKELRDWAARFPPLPPGTDTWDSADESWRGCEHSN